FGLRLHHGLRHSRKPDGGRELCRHLAALSGDRWRPLLCRMERRVRLPSGARGGACCGYRAQRLPGRAEVVASSFRAAMKAIVRITRSAVVDAPVDAVWRLVRDFNSHAEWHPAIAASRIEAGEGGDTVGAVRAFRLTDGSVLREQLIALSDRNRELTY